MAHDPGDFARAFAQRPATAPHSGKWSHYFEIYERHLSRFRGGEFRLLEIGVQNGGSMDVYRAYFGERFDYVGLDIDPRCKTLVSNRTDRARVEIGDAGDRRFLEAFVRELGSVDIVIDDGSHAPRHQRTTFDALYPILRPEGGVYIVEDLHANLFTTLPDGGRYSRASFLAYAKRLTDMLHDHVYQIPYYHPRLQGHEPGWLGRARRLLPPALLRRLSNQPPPASDAIRQSTRSVHFYPFVVVFEKGRFVIEEVHSGQKQLPEGSASPAP